MGVFDPVAIYFEFCASGYGLMLNISVFVHSSGPATRTEKGRNVASGPLRAFDVGFRVMTGTINMYKYHNVVDIRG